MQKKERHKQENTLSFLSVDWKNRWPWKPLHPGPSFPLIPHREDHQESPRPPGCWSWSPPGLSLRPANDSIKAKSKALCMSIRWLKHRVHSTPMCLQQKGLWKP
ncbi:hypothetical protein E2320_017065 [Naja naja]|nr:hypothetical protein E2320_017065 [Naja naja]